MPAPVDVHQHLWPGGFIEELRRRTQPPMMRGWTLHTTGEAPYEVDPEHHDLVIRRREGGDGGLCLVSLSSPLGIEHMSPDESRPLLIAWHGGALEFGEPFGAWASANVQEPDLQELTRLLTAGFVGLQIPATAVATPGGWERMLPALAVCEAANRPVLVHPGPAAIHAAAEGAPAWWPAMVDYTAQMQAAWWAWQHVGRASLPTLRVCFAAGAGLAPAANERFAVRAGLRPSVDPNVFVETSSFGRQGVDALIRALGIDVIVHGTDRPYNDPRPLVERCRDFGPAALQAITQANPQRLLKGEQP